MKQRVVDTQFEKKKSKKCAKTFKNVHWNVQKRAAKVNMIKKRASQIFLDPIQKRALSRSVQLEAVYLEALLYILCPIDKAIFPCSQMFMNVTDREASTIILSTRDW